MNNQWKMVPVEPTEEMKRAGLAERHDDLSRSIYQAMLAAAPVPPAGNVEVLAHIDIFTDSKVGLTDAGLRMALAGLDDVELVDRSHVTCLQAEVSALQLRLNIADQRVCDLTADLSEARRQVQLLNEAGEFLDQVSQGVEDNLRAELTEARELITDIRGADRAYATPKIDTYLAHQSAPAAKCARCEASTVEHCDEKGCGYFGAGNGEPAAKGGE